MRCVHNILLDSGHCNTCSPKPIPVTECPSCHEKHDSVPVLVDQGHFFICPVTEEQVYIVYDLGGISVSAGFSRVGFDRARIYLHVPDDL